MNTEKEPPEVSLDDEIYHQLAHHYNTREEGIAVLDEAGTICYLNPFWRQLLGARDVEALRIGNNYLEQLHAVVDHEVYTYIDAVAHAVQRVLHGDQDSVMLEYPHNRAGQWRWFLIEMQPFFIGQHRGALLKQCDITETLKTRAVGA